MTRRGKMLMIAPFAILGVALFTFIGGQIVRLLWNALLPPLFGWPEVTFWQALGLLVLCRILFGGFGGHRSYRSGSRMSPEDRERFRQRIRERFGFGRPAGDTPDAGTGAPLGSA